MLIMAKTSTLQQEDVRSIKENQADWLAYFGIKNWE